MCIRDSNNSAVAGVALQHQRVNLNVRQDALALFAQAFGHQLLNPQAQYAAAFRREERELVASLQVVVVEEGG